MITALKASIEHTKKEIGNLYSQYEDHKAYMVRVRFQWKQMDVALHASTIHDKDLMIVRKKIEEDLRATDGKMVALRQDILEKTKHNKTLVAQLDALVMAPPEQELMYPADVLLMIVRMSGSTVAHHVNRRWRDVMLSSVEYKQRLFLQKRSIPVTLFPVILSIPYVYCVHDNKHVVGTTRGVVQLWDENWVRVGTLSARKRVPIQAMCSSRFGLVVCHGDEIITIGDKPIEGKYKVNAVTAYRDWIIVATPTGYVVLDETGVVSRGDTVFTHLSSNGRDVVASTDTLNVFYTTFTKEGVTFHDQYHVSMNITCLGWFYNIPIIGTTGPGFATICNNNIHWTKYPSTSKSNGATYQRYGVLGIATLHGKTKSSVMIGCRSRFVRYDVPRQSACEMMSGFGQSVNK